MGTQKLYDVLIVGGGINGVGIGCDASSRGLNVLLVEKNDLASGTSSVSSKMIHGGLRYLEHYHFGLVRESLNERHLLLQNAPHLVHEQQFVIPFYQNARPHWFIRLGLFIYDYLGPKTSLQNAGTIHFTSNNLSPLKRTIRKGFIYSDCITDDARLVITNALKIKENGGHVANYTQVIKANNTDHEWHVTLQNQLTQETQEVRAKVLINATGPWTNTFMKNVLNIKATTAIKLVKGTHIILPKLYDGKQAYLLQNKDQRIVFVIPYLSQFTLIGTTENLYAGDPNDIKPDLSEIDYLCTSVNQYFHKSINRKDILNAYSGVRTLVDTPSSSLSSLNREYKIEENHSFTAPLINIIGGKLTTYRKLSEKVVNLLKPYFIHLNPPCTAHQRLPGGALSVDYNEYRNSLVKDYPNLPTSLINRYALQYGERCQYILQNVNTIRDLGEDFGHGLFEKELHYLMEHEWAHTVDDILWRRTKLGLVFTPIEVEKLEKWLLKRHVNLSSIHMASTLQPLLRG